MAHGQLAADQPAAILEARDGLIDITLSFAFVKCDRLRVRIERDPA